MQFYPADASVPTDLRTRDLQLRVLRPEHVERDYDAFMSSRERLLLWSGGNWPAADYTVERNLKDMHGHEDAYNVRMAWGEEADLPAGSDGAVIRDDRIAVTYLSRLVAERRSDISGASAALDRLVSNGG